MPNWQAHFTDAGHSILSYAVISLIEVACCIISTWGRYFRSEILCPLSIDWASSIVQCILILYSTGTLDVKYSVFLSIDWVNSSIYPHTILHMWVAFWNAPTNPIGWLHKYSRIREGPDPSNENKFYYWHWEFHPSIRECVCPPGSVNSWKGTISHNL